MIFPKPKFTVHDIVKDLRLTIKYVDDLPPECGGFLEPAPEPRFIAINAKHPPSEQTFTIAHELGHYILHQGTKTAFQSHWLMKHNWGKFSQTLRRCLPKVFTREVEADLWGMLLLVALGDVKNLLATVKVHPEKEKWFYLAVFACIVSNLKKLPFLLLRNLFGKHVTIN